MKFYIVDCFAKKKYQGNQLAVFIPDREIADWEMQQIANEIGFSETTFILSNKKANEGYDVRIFTPYVELPFAGHPALGTAYIIHRVLESRQSNWVLLNVKAGRIPVEINKNSLVMQQNQPRFGEILHKSTVAGALSITEDHIRDDYPVQWVSTGLEAIIVPLKGIHELERCHVNYQERQAFIDEHYKCSILAFAQDKDQLRVRVFMDDPGFLEDPATGSANGDLAGYLLKYNYYRSNSIEYAVSQGSEMGRPSELCIMASLQDGSYTIKVGGNACLVAQGDWD